MTIFVIFRVSNPKKMEAALARAFPNDYLKVADREWLVAATGTAREVSDKLGVTPGQETEPAIVFSMGNYYGRATTEIWDWIKTKAEGSSG